MTYRRKGAFRALASPHRVKLLHILQRADEPLTVDALAAAVALHVNTTREHLDRLIAAGFVTRQPEDRATRGRPRLLYRAVDGRERGWPSAKCTVTGLPLAASEEGQLDALDAHFDDLRLDPHIDHEALQVHLTGCPYYELATAETEIVCSVHLGVTRGVLANSGRQLDAVALDPFVEPDRCVLHLGRRRATPPQP